MRIGVSSYSFAGIVGDHGLKETDLPAKAKEMGFEIIEFAGLHVPEGETTEDYAKRVREAVDEAGLAMGTYAIAADLLYGSDGDLKKETERLKGEVDIAKILGAPLMRHDIFWTIRPEDRQGKGFRHFADKVAPAVREVTEYAAEQGIRTMTENHGQLSQDSRRIEYLVNAVGSENFGVLLDMGNFLCVDEDPQEAAGRLAPYAFHVHAKDFLVKSGHGLTPEGGFFGTRGGNFLRGTVVGHGVVPVIGVLRALRNAGYAGDVSIEFEGMEKVIPALEAGLANLIKFKEAAGY